MTEYISVKDLAGITGKSVRTIQLSKDKFQWRQKDKKSIEILISSLPEEWQRKVAQSGFFKNDANALVRLAPEAQIVAVGKKVNANPLVLSQKASEKQKQMMAIASRAKMRPQGVSQNAWNAQVAQYFGVSVATVWRIYKEALEFGIGGKPKEYGRSSAWSIEAEQYMKGYYLKALNDVGACTKQTAYDVTIIKAKQENWLVGGRTSAYDILNEIDPLLLQYAVGGNRALDNYFYISRDLDKLQPMQVVVGDQHIFDYWVADYETGTIYRQQCYVWLDMCTRLVYGIAFDKIYNSDTVKEALRVGLLRFGLFDCTYNDNGSSECSKAFSAIQDDLIKLGLNNADISELYKTSEGIYVVTDEDDQIVDFARTPADWKKKTSNYNSKHKAMHARVRNAKAKPIERFFNSLETFMDKLHLPGRCATPGANAAIDEKERARLEWQKDRHFLLTSQEFQVQVINAIIDYEQREHAGLKMSPRDKMIEKMQKGWLPTWADKSDIEMILFDRCMRKVDRGRVLIDGTYFIGEELSSDAMGNLEDVGLYRFEGKTVEVRYDKHQLSFAYALAGGKIRPLAPVNAIEMLDDEATQEALGWKYRQMQAVRDAFKTLCTPIGNVNQVSECSIEVKRAIAKKDRLMLERRREAAKQIAQDVEANIEIAEEAEVEEQMYKVERPPLFTSSFERYQWCIDQLRKNCTLDDFSKDFMASYEATDEYAEDQDYWNNYRKLGGA